MKRNKSILAKTVFMISCGLPSISMADVVVGSDLNSSKGENSAINALYSGNRGSKGGGDQSLQFGDVVYGSSSDDVLIGGLGIDILFGKQGNDIILGGTEDFNPLNRDRAFGGAGDDIFIWAPGDGNDFFDSGEGTDVIVFDYIGNNKAIDRILTDEKACKAVSQEDDTTCAWAAYDKKFMNQKLVVIDLVAKTVTDIEGVPLHAKRYTSPITIIDGKVYLSIEVADAEGNVDNNVYIYDIATGKATKGAKIEGKTIKGFYKLK